MFKYIVKKKRKKNTKKFGKKFEKKHQKVKGIQKSIVI